MCVCDWGDVCMFMYMLIYICVYVCECVHVQFCMKTNVKCYVHSLKHWFSCKIEHAHTHTHTHMQTHIHRLTYTYKNTHIPSNHMHIIHIHKYSYMHAQNLHKNRHKNNGFMKYLRIFQELCDIRCLKPHRQSQHHFVPYRWPQLSFLLHPGMVPLGGCPPPPLIFWS